ncbi:MAG: hypothetical protein AB8G95_28660 [Anaerolineae bacterium]
MSFKQRWASFFNKEEKQDEAVSAEDIQLVLNALTNKIQKRVPTEVFGVVNSIKESILIVLPQIEDINSGEPHIYSIRRTALRYLPETLENYLKLPTSHARFHVIRDGKTATDILLDQLNLLDREMKEFVNDFRQNNIQNLLAHGRFLKSRFGEPENLDLSKD